MRPIVTRARAHRPPPAALVSALVRAGVSADTAMAMERWKAQEVLDLLHGAAPVSSHAEGGTPPRAC
jgi:outer membrane cobalamin receptor